MEFQGPGRRHARLRHLRMLISVFVVSLVALAALVVPRVVHTAQAAAPKPANTCTQPPAGKDPTTFTTQQLKSYGLPPRLPNQNQTVWTNMLRHAKHRICAPVAAGLAHPQRGVPAMPTSSHHYTGHCSFCWAGYETGNGQYNFAAVWGIWQIPCVLYTTSPPGPDANTIAGAWVGLGYGNVVQTGYEADPIDYPYYGPFSTPLFTIVTATYRVWVENTGNVPDVTNYYFNVNCGDQVLAEVEAPNVMYIGDLQTGNYTSQIYGPAAWTGSAECILEEPTQADGLLDFGTLTFSQCEAFDETSGTVGGINQFSAQADTMRDQAGNVMAYPGPLDTTNGDFSIYWNQQ